MIREQGQKSVIQEIGSDPEEVERTATASDVACGDEPPLGRALFRVTRAIYFDEKPIPELNALPLAQR